MADHPYLEELVKGVLTVGGGGVIGAFLKSLLDGRAAKATKATAEPADLLRAMAEFQEKLSDGGGDLLEQFRLEFKFLRGETARLAGALATTNAELDATKAELAASKAEHRDCLRLVNTLRAELDERLGELPFTEPHPIGRRTLR